MLSFQKSFDLALDLSGRQPEKKLGKQPGNLWLPAPFPDGGAVALSVTAAAVPALPKGEPSLASPFGGGVPAGGGEGQSAPAAHVRYSLDEHERQRAAIGAN